MNCDKIKMMISDYLDNELPKGEEGFIFTHLADCSDCREEFKMQNQIQHEVKFNQKEVSEKFEERVFNSVRERKTTFAQRWITKPTPVYVNYVLGVVIIIISLFSFLQLNSLRYDLNSFQERYETSLQQLNYQASQMFLMMNSIPA
ncbi:MAG: zf-HC2 domain-containing protein, partial [Ignavibacteria bacterium]|nr:zf-HC2 domain-containing protein [Ignavibacteria bacterium]